MSGPIKDFVVRGRDANGRRVYAYPDEENGYEPKRGTGKLLISSEDAACFARLELQAAGCSDVAIYRVHDDGREERLPSYEEALAEIERLRAVEALNVGAVDASLMRLGATVGTIGPMPVDVFAALHAAEEAVLVAGGWCSIDAPIEGRWKHADGRTRWRTDALTEAREDAGRRTIKIGGAS